VETLLFSYGTIQDKTVQMELFGRELAFTEDSLSGYEVINDLEIQGKVYPRLGKAKQGLVYGRVYRLTKEQIRTVDEYETSAYCRISVKSDKGLSVQVYLKKE
jgi:gamma-glutamylcyclotransferase (GGCT)/AIG2-like uncharacterized protein YtfP